MIDSPFRKKSGEVKRKSSKSPAPDDDKKIWVKPTGADVDFDDFRLVDKKPEDDDFEAIDATDLIDKDTIKPFTTEEWPTVLAEMYKKSDAYFEDMINRKRMLKTIIKAGVPSA